MEKNFAFMKNKIGLATIDLPFTDIYRILEGLELLLELDSSSETLNLINRLENYVK